MARSTRRRRRGRPLRNRRGNALRPRPECPDGCGALDDYTVTFDAGAGTWTARSNSGRPPLDTWTVFASSGEHSYAAPSAALAIAAHEAEHPGDFVQAVINDAYPASVIIANLTANE